MIRGYGAEKDRFLLHLDRIQERAAQAQRQITSGYRVEKPSDAPDQVSEILSLHVRIATSTQKLKNLELAKSEVDRSEAALRQAAQMMQDITVAGTQGVSATASPEERKVVAQRIREWHSELVRIANLDYNGRYQFGGDRDDIAPYSVDWTQPGGIVRAHNDSDTRMIEDAAGNRFSISRRAQDIFDLRGPADEFAAGNVFNAVYELAMALDNNDQQGAITALGFVKGSGVHLNNELATYGVAQNRVKTAVDQARQANLNATTKLAGMREADVPAAILELTQANINLEAALGAQANTSRRTLFDYLG